MAGTAHRSRPKPWQEVKTELTHGGNPDRWLARNAWLAVPESSHCEDRYEAENSPDDASPRWTDEQRGSKSGQPSSKTQERHLPKGAGDRLTGLGYQRTTAKTQADAAKAKQYRDQPVDVARADAPTRSSYYNPEAPIQQDPTKAQLMEEARRRQIPRRSRMTKEELVIALLR